MNLFLLKYFFPNKRNLIVGCIYRHPTSKISVDDFTNVHLDPILHKISIEKKQCVIMGDFNIDLLKYHTDNNSITFFNNLSSHLFTPRVLQPTRLTSKSLIYKKKINMSNNKTTKYVTDMLTECL